MTETEFLQQVKVLFDAIERKIEALDDDFDVLRHGALLEIEADNGHKIIINQQAAMQEVWLASRSGGYHFKLDAGQWRNTRDNAAFDDYLTTALRELN
ncbi:MAG: iron donor protein CyaY [Formosimonas sp.]